MIEDKPNKQTKNEIAIKFWLSYYNRVLYEKSIITEQDRNQMNIKIDKK